VNTNPYPLKFSLSVLAVIVFLTLLGVCGGLPSTPPVKQVTPTETPTAPVVIEAATATPTAIVVPAEILPTRTPPPPIVFVIATSTPKVTATVEPPTPTLIPPPPTVEPTPTQERPAMLPRAGGG
jgi:hypothetical protein